MDFLDMEPASLLSHHNQHLEITDELFDELILNNRIQSLAAFSATTVVFDASFLQGNIPSSSSVVDSFIGSPQMNVQDLSSHLVSPITPKHNVIHPLQFNDPCFSPLSSPALPPTFQHCNQAGNDFSQNTIMVESTRLLHQQLAKIEAQQKRLQDQMRSFNTSYQSGPLGSLHNLCGPPSPISTGNPSSLLQKIAHTGSLLKQPQGIVYPTTPATPASLMKMNNSVHINTTAATDDHTSSSTHKRPSVYAAVSTSTQPQPAIPKKRKLAPPSPHPYTRSPRVLKPLISPFLQPDLTLLTIQPVRLETRRCAHKVAEQKRRDTLKEGFDSLREEIVEALIQDSDQPEKKVREEKEKQVKFMSKVLLLQYSYEHIVRLKADSQMKDEKLSRMQLELNKLRKLASSKASIAATSSVMNNNEN